MRTIIKQRRLVPDKAGYQHRGQHASLAVTQDGYRAWGFGPAAAAADAAAVDKVARLAGKCLSS